MAKKMKDSGIEWIGAIPEDWKLKKIKHILQSRNENNNPIKSRDILSLTAKQGVVPLNEKKCGGNKPKEDLSAYKLAYPNDIVMNSMNVLSGAVGLSKYFGCVSPVYYMLRPIDEEDDAKYFNYIFQTSVFQKSLLGLGNGILMKESSNGNLNTIRMKIPLDKLGNLIIPVPDGSTQQQIADYLDKKVNAIDTAIEKTKCTIDDYKKYKQSIITDAVTKGLDPDVEMKDSGIEWIGMIPKDWEMVKVKNIFKKRKNIVGDKQDEYDRLALTLNGVIKRSKNDTKGLQTESFDTYQILYESELVFKMIDLENINTSRVGYSPYTGIVSPAYIILNNKEYARFGYYYFYNMWQRAIFNQLGNNGVRSALNASDLLNIPIPLLSATEQQEIVDYLDGKCSEIDKLIANKEAIVKELEVYKKSLIYECVTGKREVL